jgi:hypothetical protein
VRTEVRRGDAVCAGFALRCDPEGGLSIAPRVHRVECSNGVIRQLGTLPAAQIRPGDVRKAVEDALSRRVLEEELRHLQAAAMQPVHEPADWLHLAHVRTPEPQTRREFERAGDRTAWGLINAVTAIARSASSWQERLDAEEDAGGILALVGRRPSPAPRAVALQQPRDETHLSLHA